MKRLAITIYDIGILIYLIVKLKLQQLPKSVSSQKCLKEENTHNLTVV